MNVLQPLAQQAAAVARELGTVRSELGNVQWYQRASKVLVEGSPLHNAQAAFARATTAHEELVRHAGTLSDTPWDVLADVGAAMGRLEQKLGDTRAIAADQVANGKQLVGLPVHHTARNAETAAYEAVNEASSASVLVDDVRTHPWWGDRWLLDVVADDGAYLAHHARLPA